MITGEVLVVFGEELAVLEGNDRAVSGFDKRADVAYRRHLPAYAVTFDEVSNLYSSGHKRYAIVDILQDVF